MQSKIIFFLLLLSFPAHAEDNTLDVEYSAGSNAEESDETEVIALIEDCGQAIRDERRTAREDGSAEEIESDQQWTDEVCEQANQAFSPYSVGSRILRRGDEEIGNGELIGRMEAYNSYLENRQTDE